MMTRSTRLEFMIVTIAFVVLLLCSRPPKSGRAEPGGEPTEPIPQTAWTLQEPVPSSATASVTQTTKPVDPNVIEETPAGPMPMSQPDASTAPRQQTRRMAVVDARNCEGLGYTDLLYGEVTVRWIWDGNRFVPRKVCVVQEPDGVTSVWSFDQPGNAVLTEIGEIPLDDP